MQFFDGMTMMIKVTLIKSTQWSVNWNILVKNEYTVTSYYDKSMPITIVLTTNFKQNYLHKNVMVVICILPMQNILYKDQRYLQTQFDLAS